MIEETSIQQDTPMDKIKKLILRYILPSKDKKEIYSNMEDSDDWIALSDEEKEKVFLEIWTPYQNDLWDQVRSDGIRERLITLNKRGEERADVNRVTEYILRTNKIKCITGKKVDVIYKYQGGIWIQVSETDIKGLCEDYIDHFCNNNVVSEVFCKIKRKTRTPLDEFEFIPIYKLCVSNGILDIEDVDNIKLLPHSEEYNFRSKLPMEYRPELDPSKCKNFINDTFYPNDVPQVQEWLGHHLIGKYKFKKAVIIQGGKNTGKSVFLNLLTAFLGKNNVSGLSLQKICYGKGFDLMSLKDKFGNIFDDLSLKDLEYGGGFKMAVGQGDITAEEKHGLLYKFRNSAKHTFACNVIPTPSKDIDDPAYYDRWLVWKTENILEKQDLDTDLIEKLITEEELSGLLNWAIEGYKRLIINNCFSNQKGEDEIKNIMISDGVPLARFCKDMLFEKVGNKISKKDMYDIYCKFCLDNRLSPFSKVQLGKQLQRYAPYIIGSHSGAQRNWTNVSFGSGGTPSTIKFDIESNNIDIKSSEKASQENLNTGETQIQNKEKDFKNVLDEEKTFNANLNTNTNEEVKN